MHTNQIARIAALVGEPARAAMLLEIMDGRSLTANELARAGNVSAQTASRHLGQMVQGGLMVVEQRGRHRYHRLASADVARVLEGIMHIAGSVPLTRTVVTGPRDAQMRMARMCYDHIAGRLGVAITQRLLEDEAILFDGDGGHVTERASEVLMRWGLVLDGHGEMAPPLSARRLRPYCRPCLDWSERKSHVAGRLGALICNHCLQAGWLARKPGSRALSVTVEGAAALRGVLGGALWLQVSAPMSASSRPC